MTEVNPNPALYRELNKPFPTPVAANEALEAFQADLSAARVKQKIADVVVLVCVSVTHPDGEEGQADAILSFGDHLMHPIMVARALGRLQADQEQSMRAALKAKR